MPSPTTLGTMVQQIATRANLTGFIAAYPETGGGLFSWAELRDLCNEIGSEFYDLLVSARAMEFFRKAFTISTVPNVAQYSLPDDFYELISVDIFIAPNQVLSARPYMEAQRNQFRWYPGWFYNTPVLFRMQGTPTNIAAVLQPGTINLTPQPGAVSTVVLNYIPVFRQWATDGTEDNYEFDGVNGWEMYIVWKVVAYCLEKRLMDSTFALTRAAEVKQRIIDLAVDREAGDAELVHDTAADYEPFGWGAM